MINAHKDVQHPKITIVEDSEINSRHCICLISDIDCESIYLLLNEVQLSESFIEDFEISTNINKAQIVIVYCQEARWGFKTLQSIRSQLSHFLKPILLISESSEKTDYELADVVLPGSYTRGEFIVSLQKLIRIYEKINTLPEVSKSINEIDQKKVQILRYFYSREQLVLKPKRDFQARVGYTYPVVSALLGGQPGAELSQLETLVEQQLLKASLIDRANTCPQCDHIHINYREVCPHCYSLHVYEEVTIHHFRCAYVGKESDFKRNQRLVCPKCSKELHHIGVDYDKPADVIWCNSCKKNFSDPLLTCFCLACAHSFSPEDAFIRNINEYSLSQEGFRAAEEGTLPGHGFINILKKELGFYKNEVFREFLRIELARCDRYQNPSILSRFNLTAAHDSLEQKTPSNSHKFRKDFAAIINETFRTTDIFTDLPSGDILIIFTNTNGDSAKTAFNRLEENIHRKFNVKLELEYQLYELINIDGVMEDVWEKIK